MAMVGGLVRMARVAEEMQLQSQRKSDVELQQWIEACRALQACYTPLACTALQVEAHVHAHAHARAHARVYAGGGGGCQAGAYRSRSSSR
eukprot:scaffold117675_cov24-Phaeocystis_antarctica.AAC.2